jgi:hypothetical protein
MATAVQSPPPIHNSPRSGHSSPRTVTGCSERLAGLRPKSPPILPDLAPAKHISKEALEKHIHNVYDVPVENRKKRAATLANQKDHDPSLTMGSNTQRTAAEVQEIVARLGDEQLREKQTKEQQLLQRYEHNYRVRNKTHINDPSGKESLSPREVQTSVDRLYRDSMSKGRQRMQTLVHQYCPERISPRRTRKELDTAAIRMWRGEK